MLGAVVAAVDGAVATGAVYTIGATHDPVAVRVHVAGNPSSAQDRSPNKFPGPTHVLTP